MLDKTRKIIRVVVFQQDVSDLFELAGIKRIICFDLHCHQIQGFFNIPCDNIYTHSLIINHLKNNIFKTNNVDG